MAPLRRETPSNAIERGLKELVFSQNKRKDTPKATTSWGKSPSEVIARGLTELTFDPDFYLKRIRMAASRVPSSVNRLSTHPSLLSRGQLKTRQQAKEQEAVIHERLKRANQEIPPYEFQNFIGKGTYGRVYVAKHLVNGGYGRVAIKVLDVDAVDFKANLAERDQSYDDFLKELKTLQQIQSYGAKNVNQIFEVMEVHSQLWIISEYCPGGSVHTLMQATRNKVEAKYLIPIARELAMGLDAVHKAFIIHRDVKAANVMIHEQGGLQIIDFGVAGSLVNETDKRKTMIGTPHWMGPEVLNPGETGYGKEVDTWAFGCTLYEMATGAPPRSRLGPAALAKEFRIRGAPRLRPEQGYSQGLCDLIGFTLVVNTKERPSMAQILEHPYLKDSQSNYPTESLKDFVREFQIWADAGGQRHSLLNPYGAEAATIEEKITENPEWRFSTLEITDLMDDLPANFDGKLPPEYIHHDQAADMTSTQAQEDAFNSYNASQPSSPYLSESDITPSGSPKAHNFMASSTEIGSASASDKDKIGRGKAQLGRIFDTDDSNYTYTGLNNNQSDLPLRNSTEESSTSGSKGKVIDVNATGLSNSGSISLADPATLKAKRKDRPNTMDWNFADAAAEDSSNEAQTLKNRPPTMAWNFPMADVVENPNTTIDQPRVPLWNPPDGPSADTESETRAPPGSGVSHESHESSGSWDISSDDDYGAPSDDAYEDPYIAPYRAPSSGNYASAPGAPQSRASGFNHAENPRQTLDLDAFGASYDLGQDTGNGMYAHQASAMETPGAVYDEEFEQGNINKARQTLDLDALMSDMGPSSSISSAYAAPQPDTSLGPDLDVDPPFLDNTVHSNTEPALPPHLTGPSNPSTKEAIEIPQLPAPRQPSAAAMAHDAPPELLERELTLQLESFGQSLEFVRAQYAQMLDDWDDEEDGEDEDDEEGEVGGS